MIVCFRKNKHPACYDSESLVTVGKPEPIQRPCGPFASCGDCSYAAHGFLCYIVEDIT